MLLAIDIGNSNIVCAVFEGTTIHAKIRSESDSGRMPEDWAAWLPQELAACPIDRVILASVVPGLNAAVVAACDSVWGISPLLVSYGTVTTGLSLSPDKAAQVGADIICNAVAVRNLYAVPAIVVDFGTATTCEVIDKTGNFVGVVILPGAQLLLRALSMGTALLPEVKLAKPAQVMGTDTVSALQSGGFYGTLAMVEGLVARLQREQGAGSVIATGGLAELFASETGLFDAVEPDLTLQGLRLIADMNQNKEIKHVG